MTLSEALEHIAHMLGGYPNGGTQASDAYIGQLAQALCMFPQSIAQRCCDPYKGVSRATKGFLPTPAQVAEWCERELEVMRYPLDRARREAELVRASRARADETDAWDKARTTRPTLADLRARHGARWGIADTDPVNPRRREIGREHVARATAVAFQRACEAARIDPAGGVSPSLLAKIKEYT